MVKDIYTSSFFISSNLIKMQPKFRKSMPVSSIHLSNQLKLSLEIDDDGDGVYIGEESSINESEGKDEVVENVLSDGVSGTGFPKQRAQLRDQDKRLSTNSTTTNKTRRFKRAKTGLGKIESNSLLKKAQALAGKRTPTQADEESLSLASDRDEPFEPEKFIREYKPPIPSIASLGKFFECYQQIYNFSKSKINRELQMILHYLQKKVEKLDTRQVDIIDDAVQFQESLDKVKLMHSKGTNADVLAGESIDGVEEIIKSIQDKKKFKGQRDSVEFPDIPESLREQEVKEIMQRFNIKLTRDMINDYSQKGTIQCNQNHKAFFDYKKSKLFMKKDDLLQEELDKERKHLIAQIVVLMEKVEEDRQATEELQKQQKKAGLKLSHSSNMSVVKPQDQKNKPRESALHRFVHRNKIVHQQKNMYLELYEQMLNRLSDKRASNKFENLHLVDKLIEEKKSQQQLATAQSPKKLLPIQRSGAYSLKLEVPFETLQQSPLQSSKNGSQLRDYIQSDIDLRLPQISSLERTTFGKVTIQKPRKLTNLDGTTEITSDYGAQRQVDKLEKKHSLLKSLQPSKQSIIKEPIASTFDITQGEQRLNSLKDKRSYLPQEQAKKIFDSMFHNKTKQRLSQSICFDSIPSIQQQNQIPKLNPEVVQTSKARFAKFHLPPASTYQLSTDRSVTFNPPASLHTSPFKKSTKQLQFQGLQSPLSPLPTQLHESPEKQHVKKVIQACLFLEHQEKQNSHRSLSQMEKKILGQGIGRVEAPINNAQGALQPKRRVIRSRVPQEVYELHEPQLANPQQCNEDFAPAIYFVSIFQVLYMASDSKPLAKTQRG